MLKKVIIVEDDLIFRERLQLAFDRAGYSASSAATLSAAIELLDNNFFDWCLCDLKLGDRSGKEVVEYIKSKNLDIKIVMLTGYGSITSAVDFIKAGVFDYISKPASFQEILAAFEGKKCSSPLKAPSLQEVEWEHIQKILADNKGNISKTAKVLNLHRRSLQRKLAGH